MGNFHGSWKLYSLRSDKEITRDNWTHLPIPDIVLERINRLYMADETINQLNEDNDTDHDSREECDKLDTVIDDLVEIDERIVPSDNNTYLANDDGISEEFFRTPEETQAGDESTELETKKDRALDAVRSTFPNAVGDTQHKKSYKERASSAVMDVFRQCLGDCKQELTY